MLFNLEVLREKMARETRPPAAIPIQRARLQSSAAPCQLICTDHLPDFHWGGAGSTSNTARSGDVQRMEVLEVRE